MTRADRFAKAALAATGRGPMTDAEVEQDMNREVTPMMIFNGEGWMTIFESDGSFSNERLTTEPTLKELQQAVKGHIELAAQFKHRNIPVQVFVNEEGRLRGMFNNVTGTAWLIAHHPHWPLHMLVGPVVILTGKAAQCA